MRTALLLRAAGALLLSAPAAPASDDAFFEREIRPLLAAHCYRCHSARAEKIRAGLRLDSAEGWREGGLSGAAVRPGRPEESLLIRAVRYDDRNLRMPPDGRLPDAAIAALERWVALGAPDPRRASDTPAPRTAEGHWAFRPIADPVPPALDEGDRVGSDVDRFVRARLAEQGLGPAPEADRRTLLRRASYGLIGLPPTAEEIDRFVADESPGAWEREVERLLASPHYGERWGRRWLDLVRYADTNGPELGLAMANAWRYRDWVVQALNDDLPYDRFLTAQLAGDLLHDDGETAPEARPARVADWTATGFLVVGPRSLKEPDPERLAIDIVDEQIDTASHAFMGVTVACARCHDHKFDPIPTEDYYALAGIFKSTSTMLPPPSEKALPRWRERDIATDEEVARHQRWKETVEALEARISGRLRDGTQALRAAWSANAGRYSAAAEAALPRIRILEAEDFASGNLVVDSGPQFGAPGVVIVRTPLVPRDQYVEYEVDVTAARTYRIDVRYASVRSRPMQVSLNGDILREDGLADTTLGWNPAGQAWFRIGEGRFREGRNVLRLYRDGGVPHIDRFMLSPPGLFEELAGERLEAPLVRNWTDALGRTAPDGSAVAGVDPFRLAGSELESRFDPPTRAELAELRGELEAERAAAPPPLPHVLAASEGEVQDLPVHIRGSHLDLAPEPTPRGVPRFLEAVVPTPRIPEGASGRLELARWLTHPDHPLTARAIVNRVWQGHFGEGLVRTPSNLGIRGEAPTHPELLDWLARRLVADAWSLKSLHRRILLSRAYRMSSRFDPLGHEVDPENRLLWRQNRRRLDAEEIRDALLSASGELDLTVGGSTLETENRVAVISQTSQGGVDYDLRRRALYLPVVRNSLYPMFATFDYVDASSSVARRMVTIRPQQALFFLNSPLVAGTARATAARAVEPEGDGASPTARLTELYRLTLGRRPTPAESERTLAFVERFGGGELAWRNVAQALLSSNEFVYVD